MCCPDLLNSVGKLQTGTCHCLRENLGNVSVNGKKEVNMQKGILNSLSQFLTELVNPTR
jgi:hypothetical protein